MAEYKCWCFMLLMFYKIVDFFNIRITSTYEYDQVYISYDTRK